MLSPEHDEHFNQPSIIVARDNSGGVDGAKRLELGATGGGAEGLGLGKAGDSLEGVDGAGRLELGETGDGARAGVGRAGGSGAGDGGGGSGGVVNGRAGGGGASGGGGRDGERGNIGAPEESSPSGSI